MSDVYKEIMDEIKLNWDEYDNFASVQEWRFALCEVLAFDCDVWMPEFRTCATEPEDTYAVETLRAYQPDGIRGNDWPHDMWRTYTDYIESLTAVLKVLDRYREMFAEEIEY